MQITFAPNLAQTRAISPQPVPISKTELSLFILIASTTVFLANSMVETEPNDEDFTFGYDPNEDIFLTVDAEYGDLNCGAIDITLENINGKILKIWYDEKSNTLNSSLTSKETIRILYLLAINSIFPNRYVNFEMQMDVKTEVDPNE